MVALRDYQEKVYNDIRRSFANGYKSPIAVLPCRSGKSYVMKANVSANITLPNDMLDYTTQRRIKPNRKDVQ